MGLFIFLCTTLFWVACDPALKSKKEKVQDRGQNGFSVKTATTTTTVARLVHY